MLLSRRVVSVPGLGECLRFTDVLHTRFHVRVYRTYGLVTDDQLTFDTVGWSGQPGRSSVSIVFEGASRSRHLGQNERWLRPGSAVVSDDLSLLYGREESLGSFLGLYLWWDLGALGTSTPAGLPVATLTAAELARLRLEAERLERDELSSAELAPLVARILEQLSAAGLPIDRWRDVDLHETVPTRVTKIARVTDAAFSTLADNPMTVDLERAFGRSRWQINRTIHEMNRRYSLNGEGWRVTRDRWRLNIGAALMSHPRATTGKVARALGYGSAQAFCRAFSDANLPSPGAVRQQLARIQ